MRVSSNQIYRQSVEGFEKANERYLDISRKIAEQSNIVKASDDPVGTGKVMFYEAENRLLDQYSKNATNAKNHLEYQEVSLDSLNSLFDKARTLIIQAGNGANSTADLTSIATELESVLFTVADLMNSKDSEGGYLFSGTNPDTMPFQLQADGTYNFAGNSGQRFSQLSDTVSIAVTDSGKDIFQDVPTRRTYSSAVSAGAATINSADITDQGTFDQFVKNNFDAITPANNQYTLTTVAGAPDTYSFADAGGNVLATGNYGSSTAMNLFGMSITLNGAAGSTVDITLDTPTRDNVLNQMKDMISELKDPASTTASRDILLRDASVSLVNTQESLGNTRASLGARMNTVSQIESYSSSIKLSNQTSANDVAGLDIATASAELAKAETAITASQQLFARITSLSLFDVI